MSEPGKRNDPVQGGAAIAKSIVKVCLEERCRQAENPPVDVPTVYS